MPDERACELLREIPGERPVDDAGDLGRGQDIFGRFLEPPAPCAAARAGNIAARPAAAARPERCSSASDVVSAPSPYCVRPYRRHARMTQAVPITAFTAIRTS